MAQSSKNIFETRGTSVKAGAFVVIVYTAWNQSVVNELLAGAKKILANKKVKYILVEVPGAVEIPFAINSYWNKMSKKPDAFIALGCVIKGDTPHFDYVCTSITNGITQLNITLPVPVIFGVLTVNNLRQAKERIGGKHGHKGEEAAATALKMISLNESFQKKPVQ
ncbi:MAG: 6,7-dimethyl-8-ribityllumazine synthase [Chitinophagaceae bacterium]|nr:6,7-dimethyl-8-ribityllumazine synthase [Chitinophagaceae bacterium]